MKKYLFKVMALITCCTLCLPYFHSSASAESNTFSYVTKNVETGQVTTTVEERIDSQENEIHEGTPPKGVIQPRKILGWDSRVVVSDVSQYPFRCIVELVIKFPNVDKPGKGTGFVIGSKYILTAGHNIYNPNYGGWADSIEVYAGGKDNGKLSHADTYATNMTTSTPVVENVENRQNWDWGLIETNINISDVTGTMSYINPSNADLDSGTAYVAGFEGEDSPMKKDQGEFTQAFDINRFGYKVDTKSGTSGAPVMKIIDGQYVAVGIHTRSEAASNSGCRFFNDLHQIMQGCV